MNTTSPFRLDDKVILVTGASSGIGRAVSITCARQGASLVITGRDHDRLQDTLSALAGGGHRAITADLTRDEDIIRLSGELPLLDGVVNSAGVAGLTPFQYLTKPKLAAVFSINFFAPAALSQMLIKKKLVKEGGSIVFISSLSGTRKAVLGNSSYSASKAAITGLAKNMALELAQKKIRVNTVLPGMIDTGILAKSAVSAADYEKNITKYPLGRYGTPEEVAYLCVYLLSGASQWMTGSELLLDGGYTL